MRVFLFLFLGNNDNSWGGQHVKKSYDNYNYSNNRGEYQQHDGGNGIEQRMQNVRLYSGANASGGGKTAAEHKESGPKKMTWATIASQPAKPQIATSTTSIGKKKGFGPPPPMIPGKHNMELTEGWDTPKNGPMVPPSPPVIQAPQPEVNDKQNSSFEGQPAWPTPGQAQNQNQTPSGGNHAAPPPQQQQQHQNNQRGNGERSDRDRGYNPSNNNKNFADNNNQNNYREHSGRQYNQNSDRDRPHQQYNSSHHYNDFQKPYHQHPHQMPTAPPQNHHQSAPVTRPMPPPPAPVAAASFSGSDTEESVLEQLRVKNQYNPADLDLSQVDNAR